MPASLLTLNTNVPSAYLPGTPAIVVFDNGDWEIAYAGDVDYIAEGSSNYFGVVLFIDFFVDLMIFFDIGDVDDLDVSGETVNLFLEETVDAGGIGEPVLLIWDDRETDVMERYEAESIIKTKPDAALNFISALDLFEEFCRWRGSVSEEIMFGGDAVEQPDEDDEPEDI